MELPPCGGPTLGPVSDQQVGLEWSTLLLPAPITIMAGAKASPSATSILLILFRCYVTSQPNKLRQTQA